MQEPQGGPFRRARVGVLPPTQKGHGSTRPFWGKWHCLQTKVNACRVVQEVEIFPMPETARPRLVGLNHVALEVGDIEEALAFYGRLFTFEHADSQPRRGAFRGPGELT
jgi:hypothetical protein